MMTDDIYKRIENQLKACQIDEDVEDVLYELSEELAEQNVTDKEICKKITFGAAIVEASGICAEEEGEITVYINWISIGEERIEIGDYFL